jgi:hypothetical protein
MLWEINMAKIALIILSSTEVPEAHGRLIHALMDGTALKAAGHDVKLMFEGIGVTWLQAFHVREHPVTKGYGAEFDALRDNIHGSCDFCSTQRFKVRDEVVALGIPLLGGEGHHFNVSELVSAGYQIINY